MTQPETDRLAEIRRRHDVIKVRAWEAMPHRHGAVGCRCLSCYDDPTGWVMDHPGALACDEQPVPSGSASGRERESCAYGPLLSYEEADALAHAADDIGFLLAVLPAPADRAAVLTASERTMLVYALDQAQEHIWSRDGFTDEDQSAVTSLRRLADEAQHESRLASPGGTYPDEMADALREGRRDMLTHLAAVVAAESGRSPAVVLEAAAGRVAEGWVRDVLRAQAEVVRGDEVQQGEAEAHPTVTEWIAEFTEPDGVWEYFGTSSDRPAIEERLASLVRRNPEARTRMVRKVTTYTVAADEAQQGEGAQR